MAKGGSWWTKWSRRSVRLWNLFEAFAAAFPELFYLFVHVQVIELEKNKLFIEFAQVFLEKRLFLEILLELEEVFEVFMLFEFLVEEAVQVEADLIEQEIDQGEPLADEIFGIEAALEAEFYKFALTQHPPQPLADDPFPVGLLHDR